MRLEIALGTICARGYLCKSLSFNDLRKRGPQRKPLTDKGLRWSFFLDKEKTAVFQWEVNEPVTRSPCTPCCRLPMHQPTKVKQKQNQSWQFDLLWKIANPVDHWRRNFWFSKLEIQLELLCWSWQTLLDEKSCRPLCFHLRGCTLPPEKEQGIFWTYFLVVDVFGIPNQTIAFTHDLRADKTGVKTSEIDSLKRII